MENKRNINEERFEFLLFINNNIICQRYFHIRGFKRDSTNSLELHDMGDKCVELIKNDLKSKSEDYLWNYYNPYDKQTKDDIDRRNIYDKKDEFTFEVRVDRKTVIKSIFDGNVYPPKVRYGVDIRNITSDIIHNIRKYTTLNEYTKDCD